MGIARVVHLHTLPSDRFNRNDASNKSSTLHKHHNTAISTFYHISSYVIHFSLKEASERFLLHRAQGIGISKHHRFRFGFRPHRVQEFRMKCFEHLFRFSSLHMGSSCVDDGREHFTDSTSNQVDVFIERHFLLHVGIWRRRITTVDSNAQDSNERY